MTTPSPDIGPPASGASINGLVLNIVLPGVGSIIGGKSGLGAAQIALLLVGLLVCFTGIGLLVGIPMMLGAWIWSIATGVQMMSESSAKNRPPPEI